jgi:hypothetical protein
MKFKVPLSGYYNVAPVTQTKEINVFPIFYVTMWDIRTYFSRIGCKE